MIFDKQKSFGLSNSPKSVQFTVHLNNLLLTYQPHKATILLVFKNYLYFGANKINFTEPAINRRIIQLINEYGKDFLLQWFNDIYGWTFIANNDKNTKARSL